MKYQGLKLCKAIQANTAICAAHLFLFLMPNQPVWLYIDLKFESEQKKTQYCCCLTEFDFVADMISLTGSGV